MIHCIFFIHLSFLCWAHILTYILLTGNMALVTTSCITLLYWEGNDFFSYTQSPLFLYVNDLITEFKFKINTQGWNHCLNCWKTCTFQIIFPILICCTAFIHNTCFDYWTVPTLAGPRALSRVCQMHDIKLYHTWIN